LNILQIISAAEITNVEAIHPGTGSFRESYFAEIAKRNISSSTDRPGDETGWETRRLPEAR
jgi:hypothetical protein